MTAPPAQILLHNIVDNSTDQQLDRSVLYYKRIGARMANVGAGAQIDRGMQFVERLRAEVPGIRVVWRNLNPEDTGILSRFSPAEVYAKKVTPYLDWFKRNQVIFMPDNETSGDDNQIRDYAVREAAIGSLLHKDGLFGAFCRFATGNIKESQYALLKPVFDMMLPGDMVSPNEYHNAPAGSSAGHLYRYKHLWDAAGRELPTTIGEFGMAVNYDPGKGFRANNISGGLAAQIGIGHFEAWYKEQGVSVFWYLIGGFNWPTFQLVTPDGKDDSLLVALEAYAASQQPPVVVSTPPPEPKLMIALPKPSNATGQHRFAATIEHEVLNGPGNGYALVGKVQPGDEVVIYDVPQTFYLAIYYKWAEVKTGAIKGTGGWVKDEGGWKKLDTAAPTTSTPAPPAPVVTSTPSPASEAPTITSEYPVVKPEPTEIALPYRMQVITYKTVNLPPSMAQILMDAGVALELVSS